MLPQNTFVVLNEKKVAISIPRLLRKSNMLLNDPRWVVFRKPLLYNSKTVILEDSGLQKSMPINENACESRVRKRYAESNEHGAKMESKSVLKIVNISNNINKNVSRNRCEKKEVPNGTAKYEFERRSGSAQGLISGQRGD